MHHSALVSSGLWWGHRLALLGFDGYIIYHLFQVLSVANMKIRAIWDIAPCSLILVDSTFQRCILPPLSGHHHSSP
jgi:hypothetical protein